MRSTRLHKSLHGLTAAALLSAASPALAQTAQPGLALDRFDPAPAGDRMFGVPSPYAAGHLTPHVMLLGDYAHDPLVFRTVPSNENLGAVVKNQLFLHLNGGPRPVEPAQRQRRRPGRASTRAATARSRRPARSFASPSKAQFGDLRARAPRCASGASTTTRFQIAVGGYVWFPTGAKGAFVGDGKVRGLPQLILGGRGAERMVWSAAAGPEIQGAQTAIGGIRR